MEMAKYVLSMDKPQLDEAHDIIESHVVTILKPTKIPRYSDEPPDPDNGSPIREESRHISITEGSLLDSVIPVETWEKMFDKEREEAEAARRIP